MAKSDIGLFLTLVVCSLKCIHVKGQGDILFKTEVMCLEPDATKRMSFSCESNEIMFINKAYYGKHKQKDYDFCDKPTPDKKNDCMELEIVFKDDFLSNCDKYETCTRYPTYTELNCPDEFRGDTYVAVEYACYTSQYGGTDELYPYYEISGKLENILLRNRVLLLTTNYPTWRPTYLISGACQVTLPPGGYLVVHLVDFGGKLVYATEGCPLMLVLHDGTTWHSLCGGLSWTYKRYVMKPTKEPWRVDITLSSDVRNSDGRAQLVLEGWTASDEYVERMELRCGDDLTDLYTTTSTPVTSSTTTTTTATTTTITTDSTTTTDTTTDTTTNTTTIATTTSTATSTPTTETMTITLSDGTVAFDNSSNGTSNATSETRVSNTTSFIVGGLVGGVFLIVLILSTVCCCKNKPNDRSHKQTPKDFPQNDIFFASNGYAISESHLSQSRDKKSKKKKLSKDDPKHYNPYITNNRLSERNSTDAYYAEIDDGSSPTHTWVTENRELAVNPKPKLGPNIKVNHDPAFDEPTATTLQLAKGTTRGFNF